MTRKTKDWARNLAMRFVPMTGDGPAYRTALGRLATQFERVHRTAYKRGAKEEREVARIFAAAEYMRGRQDGYARGHEDQMRMRIRDAQESRNRGKQ